MSYDKYLIDHILTQMMRDHIAHGYFDIDADIVFDVINNDLMPLREAIRSLSFYLRTL